MGLLLRAAPQQPEHHRAQHVTLVGCVADVVRQRARRHPALALLAIGSGYLRFLGSIMVIAMLVAFTVPTGPFC